MSKRSLSVAFLALILSTPVFASPNDDHAPGIVGRISGIVAKIVKAIGLRPTPLDDLGWPHP